MNKENITVLSFDLSSKCIGVVAAKVNTNIDEVLLIKSIPIIPTAFCPSTLGYLKSKKKLPTPDGSLKLLTYAKPGEKTITKTDKTKRDRAIRIRGNAHTMACIGKELGSLISRIKPDIILVEKNEIFNGVLTSILLGKVMGVLLGIAGQYDIPVEEYKVTKARSIFNVGELVREFTSDKTPEELKLIPDITKRALREEMERLYKDKGVTFQTDDESDACVIFHYWINNKNK